MQVLKYKDYKSIRLTALLLHLHRLIYSRFFKFGYSVYQEANPDEKNIEKLYFEMSRTMPTHAWAYNDD